MYVGGWGVCGGGVPLFSLRLRLRLRLRRWKPWTNAPLASPNLNTGLAGLPRGITELTALTSLQLDGLRWQVRGPG